MKTIYRTTARKITAAALAPDAPDLSSDLRSGLGRVCPRAAMTAVFEAALAVRAKDIRAAAIATGYGMLELLPELNYFVGAPGQELTRADFDFSDPCPQKDRTYFTPNELVYALRALRKDPGVYFGIALMLHTLEEYGGEAALIAENLLAELKGKQPRNKIGTLRQFFVDLKGNASPGDGRFLLAAAVVLHRHAAALQGKAVTPP